MSSSVSPCCLADLSTYQPTFKTQSNLWSITHHVVQEFLICLVFSFALLIGTLSGSAPAHAAEFTESDAFGSVTLAGDGSYWAAVFGARTYAEAVVAAQGYTYQGVAGEVAIINDIDEQQLAGAVANGLRVWITPGSGYENYAANQPQASATTTYLNNNMLWYGWTDIAQQAGYVIRFAVPVDNTPVTPTKTFTGADAYGGRITTGPDGHVYAAVLDSGKTWAEAELLAKDWEYQGVQGHLVSISSAEEQAMVGAVADQLLAWIGLTDHPYYTTAGDWVWSDDPSTVVCVDDGGNYNCTPEGGAYQNWAGNNPRHVPSEPAYFYASISANQLWTTSKMGATQQGYVIEFDVPVDEAPVTATTPFTTSDAWQSRIVTGANGHTYAGVFDNGISWPDAERDARDWYI